MKQQKRKGFTLVELLVVIAILAVLATVSIVGYTSFIKKANVSNDTALVKQINDVLMADEVLDGQPNTLGNALAVVSENGFDVTKLTPTAAGYDFVYDIENNRFALLDENGKEVYSAGNLSSGADLWKFVNNEEGEPYSGTSDYSLYFQNNVGAVTLESLVGVEVADGCEITSLTIEDETSNATVTIAGNIQSGTITAPKATVRHYGELGSLEINAIDGNSWHEFGEVGYVEIAKGRFVAESGADVNVVVATATVTVEDKANAIKAAYATNESGAEFVGVNSTEISDDEIDTIKKKAIGYEIYNIDDLNAFINSDYELGRLQNTLFNIGSITINRSLVLDGNGYKIMGKSSFTSTTSDSSVVVTYKDIFFSEIHNEVVVDQETLEHYGWEYKKGNLSAIYANSGFAGTLKVINCTFDNMDWECIQFANTSDGAILDVENCVFKHTGKGWFQNRYIHLEDNGKMTFICKNNDFFNCNSESVPQAAIAAWDLALETTFEFESNYFDEPEWYVIRMADQTYATDLIGASLAEKPNNK